MQFIRFISKIKYYALIIILLNSPFISCKNLAQQQKNTSMKTQIAEPGTILNLLQKASKSKERKETKIMDDKEDTYDNFSFLQKNEVKISSSSNLKNEKKCDKNLALKLLVDLGKYIIQDYASDSVSYGFSKCMGKLRDNICDSEQSLYSFWSEMKNLRAEDCLDEFTKIDIFENVFEKIKSVKFTYPNGNEGICGDILVLRKQIRIKDILKETGKDIFFGSLARIKQQPFIDSMFSVYRDKLPDVAFGKLNKSSYGAPSFIINSKGLTDIATSGLARETSNVHSAYSNKNNFEGNINNDIVTRSQKITVMNGDQIEFPGTPGQYPEGVEIPLNPSSGGRNMVINRKISFPRGLENQVENLKFGNRQVENLGVNEHGQTEMIADMKRKEEEVIEENKTNKTKKQTKQNNIQKNKNKLKKMPNKEEKEESDNEDDDSQSLK